MSPASILVSGLLLVAALGCDERCQWNSWRAKYDKHYHSVAEEEHRFEVFRTNIAEYAAWNAEPGQTAVYGPNAFSDLTKDEFAAQFLVPTGLNASAGVRRAAPAAPMRRAAIPQSFTTPYVTPARQQGTCGSCWAFTTAAVLEGAYLKATGKTVVVSPQNLLDCSSYEGDSNHNGCRGYYVLGMMTELAENGRNGGGVALESQYPYENFMDQCQKPLSQPGAVTVEDFFTEQFDEREGSGLYSRLMQYSALGIAFNAGYLQGYNGGIIQGGRGCRYTQQGYYAADHAVTLAGWGEENGVKYWLVKNSWGRFWGEPKDFRQGGRGEGYFRIIRGVGACHLTEVDAVGAIVAGGSGVPTSASSSSAAAQPVCQPLSRREACGARQCGDANDGCGTALSCGLCQRGQTCSAQGFCAAVDDRSEWVQVYPEGAHGDFSLYQSSNGATTITTTTDSRNEKRAMWRGSSQLASDSWTSFSVGVSAGAPGTVGIGMRMGQQGAPLNGIAWKIFFPQYHGGDYARAQLQQCFVYGHSHCSSIHDIDFPMNVVNNFTVNFALTSDNGRQLIKMHPYLNGWSLTGNYFYTIPQSYFPALGNAFIVAAGPDKTFSFPTIVTPSAVSAHTAQTFAARD
eukprot:m51a1_g4928 hypothetical protein (627) ;mRNA; r:258308-260359